MEIDFLKLLAAIILLAVSSCTTIQHANDLNSCMKTCNHMTVKKVRSGSTVCVCKDEAGFEN